MNPAILPLISIVVRKVFGVSAAWVRKHEREMDLALRAIQDVGIARLKEFIFAVPVLVVFVRVLLLNRDKFESQKRLLVIGSAAALSTLLLVALATYLGSLPVQLMLLLSHPFIGLALLTSGTVMITAVIVLLAWLIVYVLGMVLADDPVYRRVYDEVVPTRERAMLAEMQSAVAKSGADLDRLRGAIETQLKETGRTADARKLERTLKRVENRVKRKKVKSDARA